MNAIRSTTTSLVAVALVVGGCAGRKPNPTERAIKRAQETGKTPRCSEVGGYEAYMKKTGKVCML